MNTTTAAEKLGISVTTIRRWCRTGRIQAAKVGRAWIIDPASLPIEPELKETKMERFVVNRRDLRGGKVLWEVRDTQNDNRKANHGCDEAEMRAYAAQRNIDSPVAPKVSGEDCHYCGLNARTCDCN